MPDTIYNPAPIGWGKPGDPVKPVSAEQPLPVAVAMSQVPAIGAPLAGSAVANQTAGPFVPELGRPMQLTLSGAWTGSVQLLRSVDGGATQLPVTMGGMAWGSYSANVNEPVWVEREAGATFYLAITRATGTIGYRLAQ